MLPYETSYQDNVLLCRWYDYLFIDLLENFCTHGWGNGVHVDSKYITGSIFWLDIVHLIPRGNALAADQFIKAINDRYRKKIPLVDISQYKGVF
ncbi:MAG: hypothetical protein ABIN25_02205 [Ginsengibacter sp.]